MLVRLPGGLGERAVRSAEPSLGRAAGGRGTKRLPRIVGLGNALYLIETGALINALQALRMGLAQACTSPIR